MKGSSVELRAALMPAASNIAHRPAQVSAQNQAADRAARTGPLGEDIIATGTAGTLDHAEPQRTCAARYGATVA